MKISTLAVAGAMAVFSIAFPKSTEAETYEFWYAYQAGGLAMLCDLHMNGIISTKTLKQAKSNFTKPSLNVPKAATRDAIKVILNYEDFENCPISSP